MKRQSLIFMALIGASMAVDTTTTQVNEPVSEAIQLYQNSSSGDGNLLIAANPYYSTSSSSSYNTSQYGSTSTSTSTSIDQSITTNIDDYDSNFNLSRGQEMQLLKSNCQKLRTDLDTYNPKLLSLDDETKKNHNQILNQWKKQSELVDSEGKIYSKAFGNSSRIKEIEGLLTAEEEHVNGINNELKSLQQETRQKNKYNTTDVSALKKLNQKLVFQIDQQSKRCVQYDNEITMINNSYANINAEVKKNKDYDTEQLTNMKGNLARLQENVRGNKDKALATMEKLNGASKHCQDLDLEVGNIKTTLTEKVNGSLKKLDQDYNSINTSYNDFKNKFSMYKNETSNKFNTVNTELSRGQQKWAEKYQAIDAEIQNEKKNAETIKLNLQKQLRMEQEQEAINLKNARDNFDRKFNEQQTVLTGFKEKYNANCNENSVKFQRINENLDVLNTDYKGKFANQQTEIDGIKQKNNLDRQQFQGKLSSMATQIAEQGENVNAKLLERYNRFTERLNEQDSKRNTDRQLLNSYKHALDLQGEEITKAKNLNAMKRKEMSDEFNLKLTGQQKRVAELKGKVDLDTEAFAGKITGLQKKYSDLVQATQIEDSNLSQQCTRTEQELVSSTDLLKSEIALLKEAQNKGKLNRQKDKEDTTNMVRGYMNELKEQQANRGVALGKNLRKAQEERAQQETVLKSDMMGMEEKMNSVIKFLCWKNGWTTKFFTEYINQIDSNPPEFCECQTNTYDGLGSANTGSTSTTRFSSKSTNNKLDDDPIVLYQSIPSAIVSLESETNSGEDGTGKQEEQVSLNQASLIGDDYIY